MGCLKMKPAERDDDSVLTTLANSFKLAITELQLESWLRPKRPVRPCSVEGLRLGIVFSPVEQQNSSLTRLHEQEKPSLGHVWPAEVLSAPSCFRGVIV